MTTTNYSAYQKGMSAYGKATSATMSKMDILLALLRGLLTNFEAAKQAYQQGALDRMCALVDKSGTILATLQTSLDMENPDKRTQALYNFYTGVFLRMTKVLHKPDPAAEFDYIYANVKDIYDSWNDLYKKSPELFKDLGPPA